MKRFVLSTFLLQWSCYSKVLVNHCSTQLPTNSPDRVPVTVFWGAVYDSFFTGSFYGVTVGEKASDNKYDLLLSTLFRVSVSRVLYFRVPTSRIFALVYSLNLDLCTMCICTEHITNKSNTKRKDPRHWISFPYGYREMTQIGGTQIKESPSNWGSLGFGIRGFWQRLNGVRSILVYRDTRRTNVFKWRRIYPHFTSSKTKNKKKGVVRTESD